MYPFFETLKIENKKVYNLSFHQERIDRTFKVFYPDFKSIDLTKISKSFPPEEEKTKCRFAFNATFFDFKCSPYEEQIHKKFKLIDADKFDYSFKFSKRNFFKQLKSQFPDYEIIFTKNGKITDTTYSNLIFFTDGRWFTPETCLLKGTQRAKLLKESKIEKMEINENELHEFSQFKMINAMLDFDNPTTYFTDMIEK